MYTGLWVDQAVEEYLLREWHEQPATAIQLEALRLRGCEPPPDISRGGAREILTRLARSELVRSPAWDGPGPSRPRTS